MTMEYPDHCRTAADVREAAARVALARAQMRKPGPVVKEVPLPPVPHSVAEIIRITAIYFGLSREEILSERQDQRVVIPRQVSMYVAVRLKGKTLKMVGRAFGRDHTTILSGVRKIEARLDVPRIAKAISAIRDELDRPPADRRQSVERPPLPPVIVSNQYRPYRKADVATLRRLYETENRPLVEVAAIMGRSMEALERKIERLGINGRKQP